MKQVNKKYFDNYDYVECEICKEKFKQITSTHLKKHNITRNKYVEMFPLTQTHSQELLLRQQKTTLKHFYKFKEKFLKNNYLKKGKKNPMQIEKYKLKSILTIKRLREKGFKKSKMSDEERKRRKNLYAKRRSLLPEVKKKVKEYYQLPHIKKKRAEYERKRRKTLKYKIWYNEYIKNYFKKKKI